MDRKDGFILVLCSILIVYIILNSAMCLYYFNKQKIVYADSFNDLKESLNESYYDNRCLLYDDIRWTRKSNINGLYFPSDKYYVVWAENRTFEETESTDRHEWCHHLVNEQPEHFCEGKLN